MPKVRVVDVHEETEEEKALYDWFAKQALTSPHRLEAAARTIIGLVTALLGALFGVLAVADDPLPSYFWLPVVRPLGVAARRMISRPPFSIAWRALTIRFSSTC